MTLLKRISLALPSMTLALVTGCVNPFTTTTTTISGTGPQAPLSPTDGAPPAARPTVPTGGMFASAPTAASLARKVDVLWHNEIVTTPDRVNGDRPLPGIAGRLYVFGDDEGHPLNVPGAVSIAVHAVDKQGKSGPVLAVWNFDSATLQRLYRKDAIGHGYTLFLPWDEYKPEIVRVQLDVRYLPDGGQPLFAPSSTISLHQDGSPMTNSNQLVPAASLPPPNRKS